MSHMVVGKGRIQQTRLDMAALELACQEMGLVFCENQKNYKWFGRWMNDYHGADAAYKQLDAANFGKNAKHVIRLPWSPHDEEIYAQDPSKRPYEIGMVEMPDGTLSLVFDAWGAGKGVKDLISKVGATGEKLIQKVNQYKVVAQVAQQKGHFIKSIEKLSSGATKIVVGQQAVQKL